MTASVLWCNTCKQAQSVRLQGETYHCAVCSTEVGTKTTSAPEGEKSQAPENGLGNHNPAPIVVGDWAFLFSVDGVQQNPDPYLCTSIEQGTDGHRYARFLGN